MVTKLKGFTKDGKFRPIKPYSKVRKSRDQEAKYQGIIIRKKLEVPNRIEKGNAYADTNITRPTKRVKIKNPEGNGLTLGTDANNPVKIGKKEYWFHVVAHFGKKTFGLEVSTCEPHVPESATDKFTGNDCFGGWIAFSDEPKDLLKILDDSFNIELVSDPKKLDLWKRKNLTEFMEPPPPISAMQKRVERTVEEIEERTPKSINELLRIDGLRKFSKEEMKRTMEEAQESIILEIENVDWENLTKEKGEKEFMEIGERNRDRLIDRIENDFGQLNKGRLENDPQLNKEFPIASRIGEQFFTGLMDFTKMRILGK